MEAYCQSHAKHDPLLAPHGFFRALPHGQDRAAIEFVKQFGPLDWPHEKAIKDEHRGIMAYPFILVDFWAKRLRYTHVLQVWEARDDESNLRSAFSALYKNLSQINLAEGWKLKNTNLKEGGSIDDDIKMTYSTIATLRRCTRCRRRHSPALGTGAASL